MSVRFILTILFIFSFIACSNTTDPNGVESDSPATTTLSQKPDSDKVTGEVVSVSSTGLELDTNDGVTLTVVFGDDLVLDSQGTSLMLTDIGVGDIINVQGSLDSDNNTLDALKIEVDGTDLDDNETDTKVVMVVGAGLTTPVAQTQVDVEDDNYVSVRGTVASVDGNDVVVDIDSVDNSDQDLGEQLTVSLSDDFIKLGSQGDIVIGANVELKGSLSDTDQLTVRVLKVEAASTEVAETSDVADDDDQAGSNSADENTETADQDEAVESDDSATTTTSDDAASTTEVETAVDTDAVDSGTSSTGFNRFNQRQGGMTSTAAISGVVTAVTTNAIMLTVTSVSGDGSVVADSNITIMVNSSTQFDNGNVPAAGDRVAIETAIMTGGGRVATDVTVM